MMLCHTSLRRTPLLIPSTAFAFHPVFWNASTSSQNCNTSSARVRCRYFSNSESARLSCNTRSSVILVILALSGRGRMMKLPVPIVLPVQYDSNFSSCAWQCEERGVVTVDSSVDSSVHSVSEHVTCQ